jgi:hypothetical protein
MSLSWTKSPDSVAIAITNSKQANMNDKVLYLSPKKDIDESKRSVDGKLHRIESLVLMSKIKKKTQSIKKIYDAFVKEKSLSEFHDPDNEVIEVYKKIISEPVSNSIQLHNAIFEFLPLLPTDMGRNGNYRQSVFLTGMNGSGKTFWMKRYILLWHEVYPSSKVYFISDQTLSDDESLKEIVSFTKQITKEQLIGDKEAGEEPLNWKDIIESKKKDEPVLVIFDDYDDFEEPDNKKAPNLNKIVHKLLDALLRNGRKHKIFVLASSHELNHHKSKTILKECDNFVLFPDGITLYHLEYFCTKYLGLTKQKVKEIKDSKSRWVLLRRRVPLLELTEYSAHILK